MFAANHPFSHETIMADPKQNRDDVSNGDVRYSILHNGGFLRIRTDKGQVYHYLQAKYFYQLPDWKLHFSIHQDDLGKAWNIIAGLFIEKKCLSAMKMIVEDYGALVWPPDMHGREITVYIYQHKWYYESLDFVTLPTRDMQQSKEFWQDFWMTAEARLAEHNVREIAHPVGDNPLGRYCSLRNEAFIPMRTAWEQTIPASRRVSFMNREYCYPPNEAGWNAAGHKNPLMPRVFAFFGQSLKKKKLRREAKDALAAIHTNLAAGHGM